MTDGSGAHLDVVICTYNNAASLDEVLEHLANQRVPLDVRWRVLVVDNNCADDTAQRVERHRREERVPGLRRVVETTQALTPARLTGIPRTDAAWVAFVDDDCMLAPDWVANAVAFIEAPPDAGAPGGLGGFGGRVQLAWQRPPPPTLRSYGELFAEQDHGHGSRELTSLAGAGFVISRAALERSGWMECQALHDRVGGRLISGGDIELGLRLRAAGYVLWYVGACELRHVIPAGRTERRYLWSLASWLGAAAILADALTARTGGIAWAVDAATMTYSHTWRAIRLRLATELGRRDPLAARIMAAWAVGAWRACWQLVRMGRKGRARVVGVATGVPAPRWKL